MLKWLSWIKFSICWWHLMLHIATSNWFMDWQKYPKNRKSIRIRQPETLDSIKWHIVPGMGGRTLDFRLHYSTLQFFFVPKVLIEITAHKNSFIVLCNGVKSDLMACACTSPSSCPTVWLGTTELAYFRLCSQLDSGPNFGRLFRSVATSPPPSGLRPGL